MLARTWRRFALAVSFLTRIPLQAGEVDGDDLAGSLVCFPLVGLALGGLLAVVASVLPAALPAEARGVLVVAVLALVTGGLHLDGLADVFDALGGGRGSRERMLTILDDPRTGAHGAAALVLALIAKASALGALVARGELVAVLAMPVVSRAAVVALVVLFPAARREGLAHAFHERARGSHLAGAAWFAALVMAALGGATLLAPTLAALAAALAMAGWMKWRLGGLNGDVYGAALELAEVAFVLVAAARA
ncbi:MAG: adenosylcobinamide-GDP ribazoletransferase [Deltaproteobacteria bacterium]|nr:adenosylcobinamide-GDP ribazoletransferase [Deltaproteobacteria bacterium]